MSSLVSVSSSIMTQQATLAQHFFTNVRVPAAVLASICMKEMFQLQATPTPCMKPWDVANNTARSRKWRTLRYAYLLLMILSFSLEISTIFVSTQVSTYLSTSSFAATTVTGVGSESDIPKSVVDFIIKEFEFEYTLVRCQFLTGLITFTIAQALRVRYILRKYYHLSISGMCCLLAAAAGMITYMNANTSIEYGSFTSLLQRHLILGTRFLVSGMQRGPMSLITMSFLVLTWYFAFLGWFAPEFVDNRYH